jgi:hypothetical protein
MIEDISNSFVLNHVGFWEHRYCEVCDGAFARKLDTEAPSDAEETVETRTSNRFIVKMVMKEPCICNRK